MLAIRLRRIGKRSHATFQFVVSEKTRTPKSSVLEFLGSYDPHTKPATVVVKSDRIKHWLSNGAQPSATVHNLLVDAGVITTPKVKVASAPKKPVEPVAAEATPVAATPAEKSAEAPVAEPKKEEAPAT